MLLRPLARPAFALGRRRLAAPPPVMTGAPWCRSLYTTTRGLKSDPLRILFCGSDQVSVEALQALHEEWKYNRDLVQNIEVMVLPPRRTGRGFKQETIGESCVLCFISLNVLSWEDGLLTG